MAKPLRARFQFPGGQKVVSVPADATFQALLALAQEASGIDQSCIQILAGFPPALLSLEPNDAIAGHIKSGDTVVIEKGQPAAASASNPDLPWACPTCTFMNPASTQSCEMCNTSRPAQQSPPSPPKGMFGHQPGDGAGLGWSPATAGLYSSAQGLFSQFSSAVLDRDQDRAIIQLKSVYQQRSSACGYHSIFNTESVFELMSMMSVDASETASKITMLQEPAAFEERFHFLRNMIEISGRFRLDDPHNPVMERSHVPYLIQNDARLQQFGGQSSFECIPDLVGGVAETSELARCQAVFEKFLSGTRNIHGFVVGVHDHWISCVLHRQASGAGMELIVLDSTNFMLLSSQGQRGVDVIKSEFASRKHLEVHALKEQVGALSDEALDHIYEHGNEEPGLAPIYWQVKPLSVRIESKMARLRAAQDMLDMIWTCGSGTTTTQGWLCGRKIHRVFEGFRDLSYNEDRELRVERSYQNNGAAFGVEHWVAERGLSFSSEFVGFLGTIGPQYLSAIQKCQLQSWALDVLNAVAAAPPSLRLERQQSLESSEGKPWLHVFLESLDLLLELIGPQSAAVTIGQVLVQRSVALKQHEAHSEFVLGLTQRAVEELQQHAQLVEQLDVKRSWRPAGRTLRD